MVLMMGIAEDDMNTGDLCPRGRELYDEHVLLVEKWIRRNNCLRQHSRSYQAYRQHVDECDICKGVSDG